MFKWVKNQFLAKIKVEKFISSQYVKFIDMVCDMLKSDMPKGEIILKCIYIKSDIMKKYNLSENDINNVS